MVQNSGTKIKWRINKMENTITITRKYAILPTFAETKEWTKKIMEYTKISYEEKIEYFENKLKKTKKKDKEDYEKIQNRLNSLREQQKDFLENGTLVQANVNDYTYNVVRKAMESESYRKNAIIGYVLNELVSNDAKNMAFKERNKLISELCNYGYRVKGSSKGSLFDLYDIDNPLCSYGNAFNQDLTKKIKELVNKNGYLDGKVSPLHYKNDSPFTVAKTFMSFTHDYESYDELCEHIYEKDCNLYFNFGGNGNPTIARFKLNLGSKMHRKNKKELISTISRVYSGEYQYCGSSIGIEKNKIILNLSMKIPKQERELDENTVVGVDLGIAVPAVVALNNNIYEKELIGRKEDFLKVRTQIKNERKRIQGSLKYASGGHGRKKKLKALDRFRKKEAHFVETYCHMISKRVIDFALKNNAKYINIENLKGYDTSEFILKNWSYYKLQQYITYKAEKYGIVVRKINPSYTSQVCSVCGNWHPENRPKGDKGQAYFKCHNEECKSHEYKYGLNADFNAARNIAMSTLFMEKGEVTEKSKLEARKYYGFTEEYDEYKKAKRRKRE